MDMVKMGSFLAELRKEHNLTQAELGEKLGVTNKTISRWETGNYMPPVEMLEELSNMYGMTINELLSGKKLSTEEYKEMAETNIKETLKSSAFSLKEKQEFYEKKWKIEHRFDLVLGLIVIIAIIVAGFFYGTEIILLGAIAGFVFLIYEYNRMKIYVERNAFDGTGNI